MLSSLHYINIVMKIKTKLKSLLLLVPPDTHKMKIKIEGQLWKDCQNRN